MIVEPVNDLALTICRTVDIGKIKPIMTHPAVYPWVSDDSAPDPKDFEPVINDHVYYLLVESDSPLAVFLYHPHNAITYEVHTCVLPGGYGECARAAAKMSLQWMINNTDARKIITYVPFNNAKARQFALRCGLSIEGINRASFLKNGVVYDQYLLGITRGEICQQ